MSALPLTVMRAQVESVIEANGVSCDVQRLSASRTPSGKLSGSFVSLASGGVDEVMWIQPVGGDSTVRVQGVSAETTHIAYQVYGGTSLVPKDRIVPSGAEFEFDVIRAYTRETHREAELKQVRRV
jgi:hypothetical protein